MCIHSIKSPEYYVDGCVVLEFIFYSDNVCFTYISFGGGPVTFLLNDRNSSSPRFSQLETAPSQRYKYPLMLLSHFYLPIYHCCISPNKWAVCMIFQQGRIAQSLTFLATDASLPADPQVRSWSSPILSWRLIMK